MMISTFLIYLAACGAAASTGAMFQPGRWYDSLAKPTWTPPRWAFPVVWTVLYIVIAWAAARVAMMPDNGHAVAFWSAQIALNTLWTPVFFGLNRIRAGLVVIVLLWCAVFGTWITFLSIDGFAGLLILPYLIWVSIATALNFWIWRNNPGVSRQAQDA